MRSSPLRHLSSNLAVSFSRIGRRHCVESRSICKRTFIQSARLQSTPPPSSSPPPEPEQSSKAGSSAAKEEKGKQDDTEGVPFLSQPLGVRVRPDGTKVTWKDTVFDSDLRMERRQKLVKEASKSYFHDLNATRRHGGKTWIAPPVLIREDKARYFPDVLGTSLKDSEKVHTTDMLAGKVTLVSILSSKISEIQTHMFAEPTDTAYRENNSYQHIKINLQENLMRSMLVSFFANSIRKTIPQEQWPYYLISSQNMDYVREDIGLVNKFVGYVYLVDHQCRIRWAGCADPQPGEIKALCTCTGQLLKRLRK